MLEGFRIRSQRPGVVPSDVGCAKGIFSLMLSDSGRVSRILACVLLTALTLTVFGRLQYYGPESTLRRFHDAAVHGDVATINATTEEGADSKVVQELAERIQTFAERGAQVQPLELVRSPVDAKCEVVYADPVSGVVHIVWVLELQDRTWKINAQKTKYYWLQGMGR